MPARRGEPNGHCSICSHDQRYRIELAMVSGVGRRVIAKRFGVSGDSAWRHLRNHVPAERRAHLVAGPLKLGELAEKAANEGLALLDYLGLLRSSLLTQYLAAAEAGDRQGSALIAGKLLQCLSLIAQCSGELNRAGASITNNIAVMSSPVMADLQGMLIRALQPYPEARRAVLAGLEELSRRTHPQSSSMPVLAAPLEALGA